MNHVSIGKSSCAPYLCFRELHTQSAPKVTNYKWKHYHDNWLSLLMGWWKYLCKYISVCAPLSCSSADSGVDNVPFPQSREHSLLTEISAAMAWGMFGVDSAAPGELMRGQVVAGAHCSRSYLHLGGLGKTLLLPHLHICWVLSTGSCSMQRAHRSVHGCPGLKAFQPLLGELVTKAELALLSRSWVSLEQRRGDLMLSQWPASMAGGQERTTCLPLGFHIVGHCMLRYVLSWMPCLFLMDEDGH